MTYAWKQIWQDIRGAVGLPAQKTAPSPPTGDPALPPPPEVTAGTTPALATLPPAAEPGPAGETGVSPSEALPQPALWREWGMSLLLMVGFGSVLWWTYFRPGPAPPAPDVVAIFNGGQITIEEVEAHIKLLDPDNLAQLRTPQGYLAVVEDLISDELARRWAKERQVDSDEAFQHAMEHISEVITVNDLLGQAHEVEISVEESQIRAYYEANQAQYGNRPYNEAREEIRHQLVSAQEDDYLADYLARLRENASVTVDYTLLDVPPPTEADLQAYYRDSQAQFIRPATALVDEIRVRATGDEAAAKSLTEEALTRLRTGEDWASVAVDVSVGPYIEGGLAIPAGLRPAPYDEVISALSEAETSEVFRAGDFFYLVRLKSREPEQVLAFEEVRPQVVTAVQAEAGARWFEQVGERTLLTINGRRITAGRFYHEYQGLPPEVRLQFAGSGGLRQLANRLVDRLLLAEGASDKVLTAKNEARLEETRLSILKQMLHQEEVEDKIEVTAEEVQAHYAEHQDMMISPPQARISYIRLGLGQTEDDRQRAWAKADEAYQKVAPPGLLGGGQGLDFAEVAREYSEDPETAANGGELPGWVGDGYDLMAELTEHPFHAQFLNLPPGSITPPFEDKGSLFIVWVREKREAQPLTFEEAEPFIRAQLSQQKHDALAQGLSQKLLEQAQVVIYEQVLRDSFTSTLSKAP